MSAQYDRITRQYQRSKQLPIRVFSEIPDHLELLGDLHGRSVLDLACGEGCYTRLIKRAGAHRVVGVDVSAGMIALAREQEAGSPLGVEYLVSPAEEVGAIGPFDVVSAAFLLNYAPSRSGLDAMARAIAANLKPGGRFVATNGHLCDWPDADYRRYGMTSDVSGPLPDGAAYHITFQLDDEDFTIEIYAHSRATYEDALRRAGLTNIRWHTPRVTDEGVATFGPDFWHAYLTRPSILRLSAERPAA